MPRINRKPRRRQDPDVLPMDIVDDLHTLRRYSIPQLERWLTDYPDGDGITRLFIDRELRERAREPQCQA